MFDSPGATLESLVAGSRRNSRSLSGVGKSQRIAQHSYNSIGTCQLYATIISTCPSLPFCLFDSSMPDRQIRSIHAT